MEPRPARPAPGDVLQLEDGEPLVDPAAPGHVRQASQHQGDELQVSDVTNSRIRKFVKYRLIQFLRK